MEGDDPVVAATAAVAGLGAPWRRLSARPGWLFDGLVVDGRRPWLVLVQVLLGALLAWIARRSLVRHGVPSGIWVVQVLLFGFAAFLLLAALGRPRRLRRRAVPAPPALRIGTLPAPLVVTGDCRLGSGPRRRSA